MAYDQGYYQAPQRAYNGHAAQAPAQSHGQAPYGQQYPSAQEYAATGQYDQYAQDDYGPNGYGNGYTGGYDNQHQQPRGGGGGGGRGQYPPQNQSYPPQKNYSGHGRGGGGDPRAQSRGVGRGGASHGRAPPMNSDRSGYGGYDNRGGPAGRGHPNGSGGPANGGGQRPPPLGRSGGSDPSSRKAVPPSQLSPQQVAWDTPFPAFPAKKKKPSLSEEQQVTQQMGSMDLNDPRRQNPAGNRNGPDPRAGVIPPRGDSKGRPSGESQRMAHGHPPQHPQTGHGGPQSRGPAPGPGPGAGQGYGKPLRQNTYGPSGYDQGHAQDNDGFGPMTRSMTLPNDMNEMSNAGPRYPVQMSTHGPGANLPYNGPVGHTPPRPSTAQEIRPPPHRTYPPQEPQQPFNNHNDTHPAGQNHSHHTNQSISDLYDDYFEPESPTHGDFGHRQGTSMDDGSRMPQRQQVNGYVPAKHTKSQPDYRAQVQPQSAVYEMAGNAPPLPDAQYQQGYDQYGQGRPGAGPGPAKGVGQYYDQQQPNTGMSRQNGLGGPSQGPAMYGNNNNSLQQPGPQPGQGGLPSHPAPVRAGLIPNSAANQANNRPPPVRNYNGTANSGPITQGPSPTPAVRAPPPGPPPVTLDEIERLRVLVKTNPNDQGASLTLARKWIEAADVLTANIPDQRARNKAREKYIFDAHKMLKKLVAGQNAEAMFFLADCYGRGALGLEADNKEAFSLYQSAAKAGHPGAAYRTAVCCELGNEEGGGTRKDSLKAIQWYKRAAMLGDSPAMYKMGMIQLKGLLGEPKNPREALTWLKRAAERADAENPHALHELGLLYEAPQSPDGSGAIIRDENYALSLFKQAAELGYKFSQFRLGCCYEYGLLNLPIDARMSIMWYSRAAVQEEHQSELALSGWYLTGSEGVLQQSDTEAYLWARKAAMAGLPKAEYAMGYFTEVGIGAPADLEGAKRWYWRAAAQNFPKARERLEDLKRGGAKGQVRTRERVSRSKIGKANEGECAVM